MAYSGFFQTILFLAIYFCLLLWLCSNYFNTLLTEIHEEKKVFSCGICQKTYSDNKGVKRHIETFHEGKKNQKNHKCEVCDHCFSSSRDLKRESQARQRQGGSRVEPPPNVFSARQSTKAGSSSSRRRAGAKAWTRC